MVFDVFEKLRTNERSKFWLFIFLLFSLSLFMVYCFLPEDMIYMGYDIYFHYRRLATLMEAFQYGTPFSYIDYSAAEDFGYATKWFYPDITLIPFAWIGNYTNIHFAYKLMIFSYTFLSGFFMYKTTQRVFKQNMFVAVISSLLYTFAFYRLFTLFYRSALGQGIAMTFVPIVFLGLYEILRGDTRKWYWLPIGFSLVMMSHLLSSVLLFVVVVLIVICAYKDLLKDKMKVVLLILSGVVTFLISAQYLLPMLELMSSDTFYYNNAPASTLAQYNAYSILQIVSGAFNGFSELEASQFPSLGVLSVIFLILRIFIKIKEKDSNLRLADTLVFLGLMLVFLASNLCPWKIYPFKLLNFIQFPTRFYQIITYLFAIGSSYYIYVLLKDSSHRKYVFSFVLIGLISFMLIINGRTFKSATVLEASGMYDPVPSELNFYHLGGLEYIPAKFSSYQDIDKRKGWVASLNNSQISDFQRIGAKTSMRVQLNTNADKLEIPRFYYKGYTAKLDGEEIDVNESVNGLISVDIQRSGTLEVYYSGTSLQKYSLFISLASILGLVIFIFYTRKKVE